MYLIKLFFFVFLLLCFTFPNSLLWSLLSFLGNGTFTFSLMAYKNAAHTLQVPNPVALDVEIFFKAKVETQSGAPNLDLFLEECYSSKSDDPDSTDNKFFLIKKG